MNINVKNNNGRCTMQIEGEMTIFTAAEFKKEIFDNLGGCSEIDMDLSRVSEMDTAGLQLLLLVYMEGSRSSKPVRLISCSPSVTAVLDLFNLDREGL